MTTEAAEILISNSDGELQSNYSGRGMFGETTDAVAFDSDGDFYEALASVIEDCDEVDKEEIAAALRKLRIDTFGMGIIVY